MVLEFNERNRFQQGKDIRGIRGNPNIKEVTYISLSASAWLTTDPDVDDVAITGDNLVVSAGTPSGAQADLQLPHGWKIIEAVAYASDATLDWTLNKGLLTTSGVTEIATNDVNTTSTGLTEVVDNTTYKYWFRIAGLTAADKIYGAKIKLERVYDDDEISFEDAVLRV